MPRARRPPPNGPNPAGSRPWSRPAFLARTTSCRPHARVGPTAHSRAWDLMRLPCRGAAHTQEKRSIPLLGGLPSPHTCCRHRTIPFLEALYPAGGGRRQSRRAQGRPRALQAGHSPPGSCHSGIAPYGPSRGGRTASCRAPSYAAGGASLSGGAARAQSPPAPSGRAHASRPSANRNWAGRRSPVKAKPYGMVMPAPLYRTVHSAPCMVS